MVKYGRLFLITLRESEGGRARAGARAPGYARTDAQPRATALTWQDRDSPCRLQGLQVNIAQGQLAGVFLLMHVLQIISFSFGDAAVFFNNYRRNSFATCDALYSCFFTIYGSPVTSNPNIM